MKRIATVSFFCLILCAFVALPQGISMQRGQGRGAGGGRGGARGGAQAAPTNVQVLPEGTDVRAFMQEVAAALGVQCTYCHVQGDFPADEMETKLAARQMMRMVQTINADFLADLPGHEGEETAATVTCMMCHQGSTHPGEGE